MITKIFTTVDQDAFAALSGDYNPMHMDTTAARRTVAGAPVVHGVQVMLWALEEIAAECPMALLSELDADFARFVYVGASVSLDWTFGSGGDLRIKVTDESCCLAQYRLRFGVRPAVVDWSPCASTDELYAAHCNDPLDRSWDHIGTVGGRVAFYKKPGTACVAYPKLGDALGGERIAGFLAMTRLVGMVAPGLHSTFHKISATLTDEECSPEILEFAPFQVNERFHLVSFSVRSSGVSGMLRASRRPLPLQQPSSAELGHVVGVSNAEAYVGHVALVVGGSRGIGEVVAKLLGLAKVEVIVTYVVGEDDANAVVADIRSAGGKAHAHRLDVREEFASQIMDLPATPRSLYYFATERIVPRISRSYDPKLFNRYCDIYLNSFQKLCQSLIVKGQTLHVFYPSTVYVESAPAGLVEYGMAKAAAEILAIDLSRAGSGICVETVRLPRLPTDQTNSLIKEQGTESIAERLWPIIRRIESFGGK